MEKSNLRQQIEQTIKAKNIQPTAKWFFDVKNIGLWLLGAVALLIGSLAVAVAFDVIFSNNWNLIDEFGSGKMTFVATTLPYLWIFAFVVFLVLAERQVRQTKHGYKYATIHIGSALFIVTSIVGAGLYLVGIGAATDDAIAHRFEIYRSHGNPQYMIWNDPEKGRLAGVVAIVEDENNFVLIDMDGDLWEVSAAKARRPVPVYISEHERLKLLGEAQSQMHFLASVVLPFHKSSEIPHVLKYKHDLQDARLEQFIKQSRERNFSPRSY